MMTTRSAYPCSKGEKPSSGASGPAVVRKKRRPGFFPPSSLASGTLGRRMAVDQMSEDLLESFHQNNTVQAELVRRRTLAPLHPHILGRTIPDRSSLRAVAAVHPAHTTQTLVIALTNRPSPGLSRSRMSSSSLL